MRRILTASVGFRRVKISHWVAFTYTIPMVVLEVIILMIFTIVDPPLPREELGVGNNDSSSVGVQQIICTHNSKVFFLLQISYKSKNEIYYICRVII
jgi:hypothetical protein